MRPASFSSPTIPPVALTGAGIVSAIGSNVDELAAALRAGLCGIKRHEAGAGAAWPPIRAEIPPLAFEDALERLPLRAALRERALRAARRAPFVVRTAVIAALEAWGRADAERREISGERISVVVAGSNLGLRHQMDVFRMFADDPFYVRPRHSLEFLDTHVLSVISEVLGARGEGFTVGGASAAGNVALFEAQRQLALGDGDVCLVVAPPFDLSIIELHALSNAGALSRRSDAEGDPARVCRPFDRGHDGFVYGQAAAALVLERLDDAPATRWGELHGAAVTLDGNASTNPNPEGQARAIRRALARAGLPATAVDYINAHGTSSPLGDRSELEALRMVFGPALARIPINATKGLTGHCLSAAALVEAIATLIQMREGFLHASANLDDPIDAACGFVGSEALERPVHCALSNSYGFGGINTAVVLRSASHGQTAANVTTAA
jgi:malonyl-ACP decarboxylase